jgi:hypothetical protein
VLLALHAGVPTPRLNGLMAAYTLLRLAYVATYIYIENDIPGLVKDKVLIREEYLLL